ncbi:MAG: hypothetical protein JXA67_12620 [Micromonosporaceae bacterium]|nr:hypothetical protein [Micromonosporaceae bacterium]
MTATPAEPAAYPIPRPESGDDPRFSLGLAMDVAAVLARHGYPPVTASSDLLRLQQTLFTLIYQPKETQWPSSTPPCTTACAR